MEELQITDIYLVIANKERGSRALGENLQGGKVRDWKERNGGATTRFAQMSFLYFNSDDDIN